MTQYWGNFIQTGDCIKFIDWELAHYNYFFMELGGFIEENGLTRQQEMIFLDAYGFSSTPVESKIMAFSKAYRVAAIIGWYIERIASLRDGVQVFIAADQAEYEKNLASEMKHLERLL
jgi:thiamine kinase-like enzyme